MSRIRRLTVGLMAIGLLAMGLFGATSIANPGTADARCRGAGSEITSDYSFLTRVFVQDDPHPGTCDRDNVYRADLIDTWRDNGEVAVLAQHVPNGSWVQEARHHAAVNVRVPYEIRDSNGNSHVNMRLCTNDGIGRPLICGWGPTTGAHGDNYGF